MTTISTGARFVIFLVVAAALVATPLSVVYRSKCVENGKLVDSWSFVAPWDDPPSDCREHQSGLEVLRDEVGL